MSLIPFHNWYHSACEGKTSVNPLSLSRATGDRHSVSGESGATSSPRDTHPPHYKYKQVSKSSYWTGFQRLHNKWQDTNEHKYI